MITARHDVHEAIRAALANDSLQRALNTHPLERTARVRASLAQLPDAPDLRRRARQIKDYSLAHLDVLLEELAERLEERGGRVHWARDAAEAVAIVEGVAREHGCRRCIKTKSMTTEEIGLTAALQAGGVATVETDLGEFILQLAGDRPSHIITPMIHKTRQQAARLLAEKLGARHTEEPAELVRIVRKNLREVFVKADMAVVGVNFAVAETGSLVLLTNEGNGRWALARPRVLAAVMGMEKVIARLTDLAALLRLVVPSAVGSALTSYTSIVTGPRRAGEADGPEHLHLVILDNGRSAVLGGPYRELLRCVRCGACLNVCPVYRKVGGHAYGSVYPGPIGAALTPLLARGAGHTGQLRELSSLCGACLEACPVLIDIPRLLIRQRGDRGADGQGGWGFRWAMRAWGWWCGGRRRYRLAQQLLGWLLGPAARGGWVVRLPGALGAWTRCRDLPLPARHPFRELYRRMRGKR